MKTGIMTSIISSRAVKRFSFALALVMFFELGLPTVSLALTSGPGQPEYSSFEPASTTDMVNLYDGSFTYNIPLLTVPGPNGGYPINLAYHANPGMEEEAGWVGLGWSLNVGAINRQLQGIPDDFNGDEVEYDYHMKNSWGYTVGTQIEGGAHQEVLGFPVPEIVPGYAWNTQIYYNNYKGLGYRVSTNVIPHKESNNATLGDFAGLNLSLDSQNGIGISPSLSFGKVFKLGLAASYNNRTGMNAVSFTASYNFGKQIAKKIQQGLDENSEGINNIDKWLTFFDAREASRKANSPSASATISYSFLGQVPSVQLPMQTTEWSFDLRLLGTANKLAPGVTVPTAFQAFPIGHADNPYPPASLWYLDFYESGLQNASATQGAVGYLYHDFSSSQLQDFSKQQLEFNKKMPNLGASKQTYDLFTFSGQGTGGFFRAYSNSINLLSDPEKTSTTVNNHVTAEVGVSTAVTSPPVHVGGGYERSEGTTTSGGWQSGATALDNINAGRHEARQKVFRLHGETSPVLMSDEQLDEWKGDEAVKNIIDHEGYFGRTYKATNNYATSDGTTAVSVSSDMAEKRQQRDKRNTSVKYIDYATAKDFGYSKTDKYINESGALTSKFPYTDDGGQVHHISEVVVTQTDGVRYIYGRPVYNKTQVEFSQSVAGTAFAPNNPYGTITEGAYGTAHQYNEELKNKTTYPAYAYSWLLSGIAGTDYLDDDGIPGMSKGDKGYWVKFNYRRAHSAYQWRVPYTGASIIERRNGREEDNMGTFTYGTKEIFYLDQVETATHIALFETGCRRDGRGAAGEFASVAGTQAQKYLKKITLYARPDYEANGTSATPVMTVHFKYDYHLCKEIPNYLNDGCDAADVYDADTNPGGHIVHAEGNNGKLTLREVYFTYEKSNKAALSPYKFYYSPTGETATGDDNNPNYNINRLDRWGSYKHNQAGTGDYGAEYEYGRFPYTEQRSDANGALEDTDMHTAKWSLHRVQLPTGGTVKVSYEPHDYAYEETEKPMHMYDIVGVGNDIGSTNEDLKTTLPPGVISSWWKTSATDPVTETPTAAPDRFYQGSTEVLANLDAGNDDGFKLFFKLDKPYPAGLTSTERNAVIRQCAEGLERIWFKNKTLMSGLTDVCKNAFEYVEGYARVETGLLNDATAFGMCRDVGATSSDPFTIGYITLKRVPLRENDEGVVKGNEMQKLALQVLKLERDDVGSCTFAGPSSGTGTMGSVLGFLTSTIGFITEDLPTMLLSYNVAKYNEGHCKYIALNGNSKIKLYDEDQRKYGGGYRVKEIRLNDNWKNDETAGTNIEKSEYGQKFVYTMNSQPGGMSSGVCYEPAHGREESALRKPAEYEKSTFLSYHQMMFVEKPVMEAYYPGASVGYRKVTTYSLGRDIAAERIAATSSTAGEVNYTASAPVSVTEFYTPKEFPVYVDETNINVEAPFIVPITVPGIYSYFEAKKAASQGYSIVLNDMAGKLKRTSEYRWLPPSVPGDIGALGSVISTTEYRYKTTGAYNENGANRLDNTVQLALNDHEYQTGYMNVYYDMFIENHESHFEENGFGIQANLEFLPFPILPTVFPSGTETEMSEKTIVTHKIVYRSGILSKVVAKTDQSVVTSETLLYDSETGAPVLTRTNNLFDDPVYTLQQPAHWYYKNTGPMYKNDYLELVNGSGSADDLVIDSDGWLPIPAGTGEADAYNYIHNFSEGDLVVITAGTSKALATVAAIDIPNNAINLMSAAGGLAGITGTIDRLAMLQSGRRNLLGLNVGAVTALGCKTTGDAEIDWTEVKASPTTYTPQRIIDASAITLSDDWQVDCCGSHIRQGVPEFNPFAAGARNMWRVKSSYGYNTDRVYNNNSRTDGYFAGYDPFDWSDPDGDPNWVKAGKTTMYSPYGFEAEMQDALGNYTSARYGYGNILPVAIASNSRYADMDFEGFEYYQGGNCAENKELFSGNYTGKLVAGKAHTGTYGMEVEETPFEFVVKVDSLYPCANGVSHHFEGTSADPVEYTYDENCDCFGNSFVKTNEKYIFSAWAKETGWVNKPASFTAPQIEVEFYEGVALHSAVTYNLSGNDKIVEGWQRFFFEISVPNDNDITSMRIKLKNTNHFLRDVYYDDLRLHPKKANMAAFVYDPVNFKLKAELDANNFATFYSYDKEGNLINTKKETVRGVRTITEGRKELQKRGL